jgi:hypothetical protein
MDGLNFENRLKLLCLLAGEANVNGGLRNVVSLTRFLTRFLNADKIPIRGML